MSEREAAPSAPPTRRRRRWGVIVLVSLLALIAAATLGGWWIVATPGGAQLVLARVAGLLGKGVKIEGVEGRLGGVLKVKAIEIDRPDLYVRIDDVEIDSSPFSAGRLVVHRLAARSVEVRTASSKAAARLPVSFKPPYPVVLEDGRIGTLRIGKIDAAQGALTDAASRIAARERSRANDVILRDIALQGEGDKSRWKIARAALTTPVGDTRVAGTIDNASPFAVSLEGAFDGVIRERPVHVAASVGGTLQAMEASAVGTIAGMRATAKATLTPFAEVPMKSIALDAAEVDLSRLAANLPKTRMSVSATLAPAAKGFAGPVRIVNAEPGPWDQGRFPFRSASARVAATVEGADVAGLAIELVGGGSASGNARYAHGALDAKLRVADVDLAALHDALQKTRMSGDVAVRAQGGAQHFELSLKDPRFEVDAKAVLASGRLEVETARIVTGAGSVDGHGAMAIAGRRELRFEGRAQHFDPSAFAKTPKGDLNFTFVAEGTLADGIAGQAKLDVAASTYAGSPASGRIAIAGDRRRIARADVDVAIGEGRVTARGSFGREGDSMEIAFRAPDLAALARPFGLALAGRAEGTATLTGTFASPAGRVALTGANLSLPSNVFMRDLALRVQAGVQPDSPIDGSLLAHGVAIGKKTPPTPLADTLSMAISGSRVAHRLDVDATLSRDATLKAAFRGGL
ncbi:MAG: hypothetical protein ACXWGT_17190, partial [Usitatibacter sp.]